MRKWNTNRYGAGRTFVKSLDVNVDDCAVRAYDERG